MSEGTTGSAQCREETADEGGGDRGEQRVGSDPPVERNFLGARQGLGQQMEASGGCCGHQQANRGTEDCEREDLREKLADDGEARCAEREPDGYLMLALCGSRQQEGRDIGAGDEEEQRYGAVEEPERTAGLADDHVLQGLSLDGEVGIGFGELLAEPALDRKEVGSGLAQGDAGFHAADHGEPGFVAALGKRGVRRTDGPHVHIGVGELEGCRHDADDGRCVAAYVHLLPYGCRICMESPLPVAVAEEHGTGSAPMLLIGCEFTAQRRGDAHYVEEARGHEAFGNLLRQRAGGFGEIVEVVAADGLEGRVHAVPVFEA